MTDPGLFGLPGEGAAAQDDLLVVVDPSARYADPEARRAAFEAWVAAGRPWPPPAGLTSACAGAALGEGRNR